MQLAYLASGTVIGFGSAQRPEVGSYGMGGG